MPSEKAKIVANLAWVWGMGGREFQWTNVSNLSSLETWARSSDTNPFSDLNRKISVQSSEVILVCYELVLYAALTGEVLDRTSLKKIYEAKKSWESKLNGSYFGSTKTYHYGVHSPRPEIGDVIFFDGTHHVAIATGNETKKGLPEIASFWGYKPIPTTTGDMWISAKVELLSIEDVVTFLADNATQFQSGKKFPVNVTFCSPPW